jgi:hypothetical protein
MSEAKPMRGRPFGAAEKLKLCAFAHGAAPGAKRRNAKGFAETRPATEGRVQ